DEVVPFEDKLAQYLPVLAVASLLPRTQRSVVLVSAALASAAYEVEGSVAAGFRSVTDARPRSLACHRHRLFVWRSTFRSGELRSSSNPATRGGDVLGPDRSQ